MQRKQMLLDTVRNNRKNMPKEFGKNQLKAMKLKKGDVIFRLCDKGRIAIIWKDKNYVRMLSTMHTSGMEDTGKKERNGDPRLKSQCVLTYNGEMGGMDASDQMAATYRFIRKYVKWSKKLFFYLLDIVVLNSFYLYKEVGGSERFLDFRKHLLKELVQSGMNDIPTYPSRGRPHSLPSSTRLVGRHFPVAIPPTEMKGPCKRCVVCSSHNKRKHTKYKCATCGIPLCAAPCFKDYHVNKDY